MARCAALVVGLACAATVGGAAGARADARPPVGMTASLTLIATPTPRLPVPGYDTTGVIPQVREGGIDLTPVNTALREAGLADQRAYAPSARRAVREASRRSRGIYRVEVDPRLVSASTVLVSAVLPTTKLYPGGNN